MTFFAKYDFIIIFYLFIALQCSHSYSISFPTYKRNYAVISKVDIKLLSDYDKCELIKLFKYVIRSSDCFVLLVINLLKWDNCSVYVHKHK